HRYNAACGAALAGCGRGKDAASLTDEECARWRKQAQGWLRADLAAHGKRLQGGNAADRAEVRKRMQHWLADPHLAGVRAAEALPGPAGEEREGWTKLGAEGEALSHKAQLTK